MEDTRQNVARSQSTARAGNARARRHASSERNQWIQAIRSFPADPDRPAGKVQTCVYYCYSLAKLIGREIQNAAGLFLKAKQSACFRCFGTTVTHRCVTGSLMASSPT